MQTNHAICTYTNTKNIENNLWSQIVAFVSIRLVRCLCSNEQKKIILFLLLLVSYFFPIIHKVRSWVFHFYMRLIMSNLDSMAPKKKKKNRKFSKWKTRKTRQNSRREWNSAQTAHFALFAIFFMIYFAYASMQFIAFWFHHFWSTTKIVRFSCCCCFPYRVRFIQRRKTTFSTQFFIHIFLFFIFIATTKRSFICSSFL